MPPSWRGTDAVDVGCVSSAGGMQDEAFMLPVLLRLNGSVQVSEAGEMLYVFPELQRRAARGGDRGLGRAFRAALSWVEDKAAGTPAPPPPFIAQEGALGPSPLLERADEECCLVWGGCRRGALTGFTPCRGPAVPGGEAAVGV